MEAVCRRIGSVCSNHRWLALVATTVYANTLLNGFVYDDRYQLLRNPLVTDLHQLAAIFTSSVWAPLGVQTSNYYRPLQILIYKILYVLAGPSAFVFHLFMVSAHVANTLLLHRLTLRLTKSSRLAVLAALVFAVHPIHTEAVAWVAALPDVVLTSIVLWALCLFDQQQSAPRAWQVAGHCSLYLAALMTKETGAMLLLLYAGHEWAFSGRRVRDLWRNKSLYLGLSVTLGIYLVLRVSALGGLAPMQNTYFRFTLSQYFLSAVHTLGTYLLKLLMPAYLNAFHVFHITTAVTFPVAVSLVSLVALVAVMILSRRRVVEGDGAQTTRPALLAFGVLWIFVMLTPVLNLAGIGENVFAERYLYLPSVGFVWIVAIACDSLAERNPRWTWAILGVVMVACSAEVITRNLDWRDDAHLFTKTVQQSPRAAVVHNALGASYIERGEIDAAIAEFRIATELQPGSSHCHTNLGEALLARGRTSEAIDEYKTALLLTRDETSEGMSAHFALGLAFETSGELKDAEQEYRITVASKQDAMRARSLSRLGAVLLKRGNTLYATEALRSAIVINPSSVDTVLDLAKAYSQRADYFKAVEVLQAFLGAYPDDPSAYLVHRDLAMKYTALGYPRLAEEEFRKATDLQAEPRQSHGIVKLARMLRSLL